MEVCDRPWCNGITQKNKRDVRDVSVVYEKGSVKKRKGVWLAFSFGRGKGFISTDLYSERNSNPGNDTHYDQSYTCSPRQPASRFNIKGAIVSLNVSI